MTREERIEWFIQDVWEDYRYKGYEAFKDVALKLINWADEHPKNPWRDAKKELPEETGDYLVCVEQRVSFAFFSVEHGRFIHVPQTMKITHWMPIPKLKKGE